MNATGLNSTIANSCKRGNCWFLQMCIIEGYQSKARLEQVEAENRRLERPAADLPEEASKT